MKHHAILLGIPILVSALALIGAADLQHPEAQDVDRDGDGMPDAYERFFGLDPANPADAQLDSDGDGLSNFEESARLTDPWASDTDIDGFDDHVDANPISRAYIQWGRAPVHDRRPIHLSAPGLVSGRLQNRRRMACGHDDDAIGLACGVHGSAGCWKPVH